MSSAVAEPSPSRRNPRKESIVRRYRSYRSSLYSKEDTDESSEQAEEEQKKRLVVLISKGVHDRTQASHQNFALNLLRHRKVPFEIVDGMDVNQRERRNELFEISGIRGNYPQFFFVHPDGSTTFFGNWAKMEGINETDHLPREILEENPDVETWDRVFGSTVASFS